MRRTLSLLIFCLVSVLLPLTAAHAQGTVTPTWTFQTYGLQPFGTKNIIITPLRPVGNNGNLIAIGDPIRGATTNSAFTTNLLNASYYRVEFWSGYNVYGLTNFFDANTTGAVDGGDLLYRAYGQPADRGGLAPSLPYGLALWILKMGGVGTNAAFYGSFKLPVNTNTQVGYVWTVTNVTTGAGEFEVSSGGGGGGGGGSGETNLGANIGSGVGVFAGKSGVTLQFKDIAASGGATVSTNANTLTIAAEAAGAGLAAATAATNGFPWGVLYDPLGAAATVQAFASSASNSVLNQATNATTTATNSIGLASGLAAYRPTNSFVSTNPASSTVLGPVKVDNVSITAASDGTLSAVNGGSGNVLGPSFSTDATFAFYQGTSGKVITNRNSTGTYSPASFDLAGASTAATNSLAGNSVLRVTPEANFNTIFNTNGNFHMQVGRNGVSGTQNEFQLNDAFGAGDRLTNFAFLKFTLDAATANYFFNSQGGNYQADIEYSTYHAPILYLNEMDPNGDYSPSNSIITIDGTKGLNGTVSNRYGRSLVIVPESSLHGTAGGNLYLGVGKGDTGQADGHVIISNAFFYGADGSGMTNLIHGPTTTVASGGSVALSKNPDGSTNYAITVTVAGFPLAADANMGGFSLTNGNNLSLTGAISAAEIDAGLFILTNITFLNVFTNVGSFMTNASGWVFQGSNGVFASSNAQNSTYFNISTNRTARFGSNGVDAVTITPTSGNVTATSFTGSGAALTSLPGSAITGTIPLGALPSGTVTNNYAGTLTANGFTGSGSGLTNTVSWTHEGTTTNITAAFNGTLQTFTVTNGPSIGTNLFFHYAGANGSVSYRIVGSAAYNTLAFDYQPKWLAGSNSVITNGVLSLTSYGGTNATQIEAAIRENQ